MADDVDEVTEHGRPLADRNEALRRAAALPRMDHGARSRGTREDPA